MATKQFGKLKLHWSKRGVAFKWGDGEIHRWSFEGRKPQSEGNEYDRSYTSAPYSEEGYDSPNYDAQPGDGYYGDQPYDAGRYSFLYSNDILMYALLVLLPPLGIWILWKRERFTPLIRGIISAISGVWFIVLLIWLFSALLGGPQDNISQPQVPQTQQTNPAAVSDMQTQETAPEDETFSETEFGEDETDLAPQPTPISVPVGSVETFEGAESAEGETDETETKGVSAAGLSADDICYSAGTSAYFHANEQCPNIEDNATRTTVAMARSRSQSPCPECYDTETTVSTGVAGQTAVIYATASGKYYHVNQTCGNMTGAIVYTLAQAQKEGKKPCPTCIGKYYCTATGKYYHTNRNCSGMSGAYLTTAAAAEAAGKTKCPTCLKNLKAAKEGKISKSVTYYSTNGGKYYHVKKECQGMKGAQKVTTAVIKKRGQTPCPVCIGSTTTKSSGQYYATRTGKYYHTKSNCSGMKGATKISLATAKKYGKKACSICVSPKSSSSDSKSSSSAAYYATTTGKYYHKTSTCSGMKGAKKITKATAEKKGKTACPVCLKGSSSYVYFTTGGKYYHKNGTCSGMKNAKRVTLASAKASGKTACPTCYKSAAAKSKVYYATASSKYYHVKSGCSGMKNPSKVSLATAKARGKTACPVCIGGKKPTTKYYYATRSGKHYHTKSNCSGMTGASKVTLAQAQKAKKTPCPVCVKKTKTSTTTQQTQQTSVKKVYCYASSGSKYYHKDKGCSGLKSLKKVLLTTAKKRGRTACPVCVTKTVDPTKKTTGYADKHTTCYASKDNAYYHANKGCVPGLSKTTVSAAKKKGKTQCPACAGKLNVYVYVNRDGTKYHRKSNCGGMRNPYKVSVSTAVQLNYVRCTKCNAPQP